MEVCVSGPGLRASNLVFPDGSAVRDVVNRFVQDQGVSSSGDFYVVRNGRLADLDDPVQRGAVYHLEPRLCGGKGGFGSMLRALGAQIEKTTNREACRDLSGRRLRDVNHEKEMAEWLKKQAEREAEKEQRRLERLQRKLSEPKHQFTDAEYQQQCHDLSERLEDSVIKGLQASSSSQVKVDDVSAAKRPNLDQSEQPRTKKTKKTTGAAATAFLWTGVGELLSSEEEDGDDDQSPSSSSSCGAAAVTMTTQEAEPEQSSSSSSADQTLRPPQMSGPPEDRRPPQMSGPPEDQRPPQMSGPPEDRRPPQMSGPPEDRRPPQMSGPPEDQRPPQMSGPPEDRRPPQMSGPPEDQRPPQMSGPPEDQTPRPTEARPPLDVSSASDLESLGLDVLKEELMSRGLKCGGTLTERAARLFAVRGLSPDQIDPALLAKPAKTRRK
ncbi:splicing regulator SDE2 [Pempheris klunzingeri]|uniref:splicing regulator SDE2 n=1 Tax=Pempheris klunzingeri TaxID=3127111 RepID=UPI00397EE665